MPLANQQQSNPWGGTSQAAPTNADGVDPLAGLNLHPQLMSFYRNAQQQTLNSDPSLVMSQSPQGQAVNNIPNAQAIGNVNGAIPPGGSLMPDIPDYLGQAGQRFNNFQPVGLGDTPDFSGIFDSFDQFQSGMGKGPQISMDNPVSGQMQQQMLNSAIGANANQRQSSLSDAVNRMGSRGFTSESPALQATSNRLGLNEALANTQARVDIPLQAARQNSDYQLAATQANLGQRNADYQNFTGLENAKTGRLSPLLQSLVGLV